MKNKKHKGSFYTPKGIADFIVARILAKIKGDGPLSILEPSAGDGIFIHSLYNSPLFLKKTRKVVAVEREKKELDKISSLIREKSFEAHQNDFLRFQENNKEKFDVVIGNPPYIKKNFLKPLQIAQCEKIHNDAGLSSNKIKNIWTAFLVRCIDFIGENGIIAFILPSELLQVKFAAELRQLLLNEFERIEIFTFNELLFEDCKGQDTLILIGERKANDKGIFYANVDKVNDLLENKFELARNINIKDSKWHHHQLTSDESELLEKIKKRLNIINHYCSSKAGIVTGANDFFIVNNSTVEQYSLQNYVKPIVQKGSFVNGSVVLSSREFRALVSEGKPTYLLTLNKSVKFRSTQKICKYLTQGQQLEVDKGYKTTIRENWYEVPNIGCPAEAFFFKRSHEYPKLIMNKADVLATDGAYIISMNEKFNLESLIYSFYNSLTLSFAELHGRYYGGGVLELTPNEFKNLPVPYIPISKTEFKEFAKSFEAKTSIKEVCKRNDAAILKSIDKNLTDENIQTLYNIREKLYLRRTKIK